jgi:glycosyltransferase involved in cell wall biosynthesis
LKDAGRKILFLVVGDGKERPRIEEIARTEGLDNVRVLDAVPKRRVPEVLAASNVCLATLMDIPMFGTTYPNKVFDCMAAGRPIILAIDGAIRKVVEEAGGGIFVPPADDRAIADAILQFHSDPKLGERMGRDARTFVSEHFDRHKQSVVFFQVLQSVADV